MSLAKRDISINISNKAQIPRSLSDTFLDSFISIIKSKSVTNTVKISNFGSFFYKKTPRRLGRNPKTKESYPIPEKLKLNYLSSNKVRNVLN